MDGMDKGLCLDTMTLHAMCISGSNLESKMGEAVQCFMDDGEVDDEEDEEKGKVKEKERDVLHLMI